MAMVAAKKRERMRSLTAEAERREAQARAHFAELATEGLLDRAGLKVLLAKLNPEVEPTDDGVEYVHRCLFPGDPEGKLGEGAMMRMNKLYHYWCAKEASVDVLFARHDTDKSGLLNRDQMKNALVEIEKVNADKRACTRAPRLILYAPSPSSALHPTQTTQATG